MGTNYYLKPPLRCNAIGQICAWLSDLANDSDSTADLAAQLNAIRDGILEGRACKVPCICDRQTGSIGLHIGKSSGGWCFSLHCYDFDSAMLEGYRPIGYENHPSSAIAGLDDWIPLFEKYGCVDDYGGEFDAEQMISIICDRTRSLLLTKEMAIDAGGAFDPTTNLIRHKIDGERVRAWGPGTWDLCYGDFS